MFGLLGANGAGKTTLLRLLAGRLQPTEGRVGVGGHCLATRAGRRAVRRALGYLPQDFGVYPDLTAREFLDYMALLKGVDRTAERRRRVGALLELVDLSGPADDKLRTFSGGMRRRVGIAQALLGDPRLVIVDEPTAELDPQERVASASCCPGWRASGPCCSARTSSRTSRKRPVRSVCWARDGCCSPAPRRR
ncbi:ATP-binding cassette domain-containing protein [Dactylosporangium sp. McL0621]|uniref:ATP-binding cassette domain-containing protein n=1 Tax=Dactylosporangium sp. McL0621 TaxID=3415678 RepID=UPI003CF6BB49